MRFPIVVLLSACVLMLLAAPLLAQSPNGVLNGQVVDPSNGVIVGADVVAVNDVTGLQYTAKTNNEGIYVLQNLPPGPYRLQVSKVGFKTLVKPDITLNVQDALAINFTLPIGALSETVTVQGGAPLVNTESATVSTVVDRQFAENLPMNGRSFQTLIELAPGVVLTASNTGDSGQFSVNGQRASSNYWTVDGASANIGSSTQYPGNGTAGALAGFSVLGGTNSLVSVDALQEFRIQTSTYAPEFGRTPGGQISIVTRSGTNRFHGSAFEYLRNDVVDANDWFAAANRLPKPEERQNDFGGTFSGPLHKDRTFFFISYEGFRLRLPQVAESTVPSISARQAAIAELQPYLNAYPVPASNAPDTNGVSPFNASYSNPASLNAYSIRVDHKLTDNFSIFGRYNYSPSEIVQRGPATGASLSTIFSSQVSTQTATAGLTWVESNSVTNDLRFNYSRANASSHYALDSFGGAVPLSTLPFPSQFDSGSGEFIFEVFSLENSALVAGHVLQNLQQQLNLIDGLSVQKGTHSLKFGVDYRRLTPETDPQQYAQIAGFLDIPSVETGSLFFSFLRAGQPSQLLLRNLSLFAQDTWRARPRLTLTYGLRWDVDFAPTAISGPNLAAATGFNLDDLSTLSLAPVKTPPFATRYGNFAPRFGIAYQLSQRPNWGKVLRGGFGVFYDLATQEVGSVIHGGYPYSADLFTLGGTFPLDSASAAPPPFTPPGSGAGTLLVFDPQLHLPHTLEWNVAIEQELGKEQTLSASYVGAVGRQLIQTAFINSPNPNLAAAQLVTNAGTSDYNSLQVQFQRRLRSGLQALASYSWAHSIDTASAGSAQIGSNALLPSANENRGPSDFDIRHATSVALTYELSGFKRGMLRRAISSGWSIQNVLQAHSAPPVNIYYSSLALANGFQSSVRPDIVAGQGFYIRNASYPGGIGFNSAAFASPPTDPSTGAVVRQGNLSRNGLRGFGAAQWDCAVHRQFVVYESFRLEFRAEAFNLLNHPNFGPPVGDLGSPQSLNPQFGRSNQMLGQYLSGGNLGGGGLSPLYQLGGPRSIQLALKLLF